MAVSIIPQGLWPALDMTDDVEDFLFPFRYNDNISVSEDDKHVYIEAPIPIPGIEAKDIEVSVNKGMLWIQGQANQEKKERKYYHKASESFAYRVTIPVDTKIDEEPEATYKNGVMTVTFAKSEQEQSHKIPVKER